MTRRVPFLALLVAACGGGGVDTILQEQPLSLRGQVLAEAEAGSSVPILVTVRRGNALVTDYTGAVRFESSDPEALLPSFYRFTPEDRGQRTFGTGFLFPPGVHILTITGDGVDEPVSLGISVKGGVLPGSSTYGSLSFPSAPPGSHAYMSTWKVLSDFEGNDVALADIDGDGDLDLVLAGWGYGGLNMAGTSSLWLNDGDGNFERSLFQEFSDNARATRVACADIDGDGDVDLALSGYGVRIWRNSGGTLTDTEDVGGNAWDGMEFADVDGDGAPDLVVNEWKDGFAVYKNDGKGSFGAVLQSQAANYRSHRPVLADFDGDGDVDLFASDEIWSNDGKGHFASTGQQIQRNTYAAVARDMDADGDVDLVLGNWDEVNDLYVNDGEGTFTRSDAWPTGKFCTSTIAVLDVDEDGDLDILEGNVTSPGYMWLREGSVFVKATEVATPSFTQRLVVADMDGDGLKDVFSLPLPHIGLKALTFHND